MDIYAPAEDYLFYLPNIRISTNPERFLKERQSGVSFSASVVTGVLSMMWNANPCMTNAAHVQALLNTADEITLPNKSLFSLIFTATMVPGVTYFP